MSAAAEEDGVVMLCASCGTAGSDDIKLKKCTACYLVRYCSVKCQRDHRPKHKKACRRRAAELKDELLFKQPESSYLGDCPICCLPLSYDGKKTILKACCSKVICSGCDYANQKREWEARLQRNCPFCRKTVPNTKEESDEQFMKRVEMNDPVAVCQMGTIRYAERDYKSAFEYLTKAVAMGSVQAHYQLSVMYQNGHGVEKDEKKELHHLEQAAIGGHPDARHNLGCVEAINGQHNRAMKHFIIAANLGHDDSLDTLKKAYKAGHASKEDFATALSGYQSAIEATKSPQREEAAEYYNRRN